ncbi:J domain-containing protein [Caldimonas sp. KR1-144]|uniref:J domain-containing protein n=1 Tax=Caldimonas sp. KR1-144 TaxID=3400911 RepID=UPI003C0B952B
MSTTSSSSKSRPRVATYYARLKVAQDAPPEVIRAAHRALVQKYHPDRHQGSLRHEQVVAALNRAQDILLDPDSRAAHDQWIRDEEVRLGLREAPPGERDTAGARARAWLQRQRQRVFGAAEAEPIDIELRWMGVGARPRSPMRRYGIAITLMALAAGAGAGAVILSARNDLGALVAREALHLLPKAASAPDR